MLKPKMLSDLAESSAKNVLKKAVLTGSGGTLTVDIRGGGVGNTSVMTITVPKSIAVLTNVKVINETTQDVLSEMNVNIPIIQDTDINYNLVFNIKGGA